MQHIDTQGEPITRERLEAAFHRQHCALDNPGFCLDCGADHNGCEPDAARYHCDECQGDRVFGLLFFADRFFAKLDWN